MLQDSDRALHHRSQTTPGGDWYDWGHRGGTIDQIAVTQNANRGLEVFTIGTDHAIWHNWQSSPGSGTWSGWNSLGGWLDRIYASQLPSSRIEIFGRGQDGALWHNWQPNLTSWNGWAYEGGTINQPFVERNSDGRLIKIEDKQILRYPPPPGPIPIPIYDPVGFVRVYDPEGFPPYLNGDCISSVWANVQSGYIDQDFSAREGGCAIGALIAPGINHFRVWPQASTGARFLTVSTETFCLTTHCVMSYDEGRSQLLAYMRKAATNAGWPRPTCGRSRRFQPAAFRSRSVTPRPTTATSP